MKSKTGTYRTAAGRTRPDPSGRIKATATTAPARVILLYICYHISEPDSPRRCDVTPAATLRANDSEGNIGIAVPTGLSCHVSTTDSLSHRTGKSMGRYRVSSYSVTCRRY